MIYALKQDKMTQAASDIFNKPGELEKILNITPAKTAKPAKATTPSKKKKSRK